MRRKVESLPHSAPVDAHERSRDYLSEEDFGVLLQGTLPSRHRWRNAAMLMLTFYHGLRVTELCRLKRQDIDLHHGRLWVKRLKGSLSTEQPLQAEELRALKRYLKQRGDSQLPWLFSRSVAISLRARPSTTWSRSPGDGRGGVSRPSAHAAPWLWLRPGEPWV